MFKKDNNSLTDYNNQYAIYCAYRIALTANIRASNA